MLIFRRCGVHTRALSSQHRNAERPSMTLMMLMAPLNDGSILRGLNNKHQSCWIQESKSGFLNSVHPVMACRILRNEQFNRSTRKSADEQKEV
ncbi:hypothetical protein PHYPO_G00161460 [Pangasianodon hypophthalmus]|uniref:Uncharacterized protein n=1 Tax=Pangasianodon hypophthalmus TaxID=310915 RepID=A0A5N5JZ29_PANHP|nr:hypothetical protein PHYPO_G00161460 [Pangasianodon hypophthalmus]